MSRPPGSRRRPRPQRDGGFTLVEILVSIMIMGILMTALTSFFTTSVGITNQQSGRQTAAQLADGGIERVRAMRGSSVITGRDKTSSDTQWASPVTGVATHLADMQEAWDPTAAAGAGATAPLPTIAMTTTVNGLAFSQYWYIGRCWQPAAGGDCGASQVIGYVGMYRVVVTVTWRNNRCTGGTCSYVTSTLVSNTNDPIFNTTVTSPPPAVTDPGTQTSTVTAAVSLQLASSGGTPPVTWSASNLPPGLVIASDGLITGTPTTAGSYAVVATATGALGPPGSASFTWNVNPAPVPTNPGNQVNGLTAVSLQLAVTGGTSAYTWSVTAPGPWGATGLPPGLSLNTNTGLITGTPTTMGGPSNVTVTVRDSKGVTASMTFSWQIQALLANSPGTQNDDQGETIAMTLSASGGTTPYTWSVANLPPGLSYTSGGSISGWLQATTRYLVTATVTDANGATSSVTFVWNITSNSSQPRITAPTGDRTDPVNTNITAFTAAVTGGGGSSQTWTATGLPSGVTMTSGGVVSGRPNTVGVYTTTLTVTLNNGKYSKFMFRWTVQ